MTVIENGNEAVMGAATSTTGTAGAVEGTAETTTTEGTTATIVVGVAGMIATTSEATTARATIGMIGAMTDRPTTATMMIIAEGGGTRTIVLGAEALPGTTMEEEEAGREGKQ